MADPLSVQQQIAALKVLATSARLTGLYELGIAACADKRRDDVEAVVQELIASLDYEYANIADAFNRVYTYCLEQARERAFERVAFILTDLRDTLQQALADGAPAAR
ncbi:MAG: hypothetical protein Q8R35_04065 [bacterium]|nr:hypothetical protein [bacterium]